MAVLEQPAPEYGHWDELAEEELAVRRRRFVEARDAGLSIAEAQLFADSQRDIGELRALVRRGCPARLIARIVV